MYYFAWRAEAETQAKRGPPPKLYITVLLPITLYEYLVENGWEVEAYYYEEGMQFCGQFVDGEDSRLIDFITPLYDFYDTDEEGTDEEDERESGQDPDGGNKNGV